MGFIAPSLWCFNEYGEGLRRVLYEDLLFHDSYPRHLAPSAVGVPKLVKEIEAQHAAYFTKQAGVGSIAHFVCTQHMNDPKN